MELIDIEYELKHLDPKNTDYKFWDDISTDQLKQIACRYKLDQTNPKIFSMIWNYTELSRKQRYYIIYHAAEIEKTLWL